MDVMGRACGTYGGKEKGVEASGGNLLERDHLAIIGVDDRITLKWTYKE
jgi:hypothetical protein